MRCPVVPTHTMIQIAPAVWQCPDCGAGPRLYFSLARVAIEEGSAEALQITWKPELDSYVLSDVFWEVNESGKRLPGSYESELLGYVSTTKELDWGSLSSSEADVRGSPGGENLPARRAVR
jgi:hypothetical protein